MMKVETAINLAKYSNWADQVLFTAMKSLPEGAIYQKSNTLFKSMVGTLNHNYVVDLIWRAHLLGEKHNFSTRRDVLHPVFNDLIDAQSRVNQWYIDWAGEQTIETFSECLKFNFVSGQSGEMTRGDMFLHIINHKTYHRGWVSQMFFEYEINPPETDLCVFLCDQ
ncbi:DinB family protein [Enterobacter asburiae]|jgi:uncharacterized damage-inducible protein DinB|uniref:Damage-inducible protein DinB n=5 Tax=Enterobacteriaceae TaxID=543 RepID=A0A7G9A7V3_RAOOR|nr:MULTISPECIES: DinB family protein [Enterobacteriaceae]QZS49838.1 DinB family protein [Enterobacter cloacae complex sp.]HCB0093775.1 DinB family protein [Klebsiella variicola subsp. variicola]HCC6169400.1 DinB family protein [Citrobacter amalonaticus]ATO08439.1 damage-inducible protein DinB [Klebsiella pneumoniae subsp. pneumoniae]AVE81267.1 damage-inducible protein DinB [Klebsiella oxytoca]